MDRVFDFAVNLPQGNNPELTKKLRDLWKKKPSATLFDTACRLGLGVMQAEKLVNELTATGVVSYKTVNGQFKAVFA